MDRDIIVSQFSNRRLCNEILLKFFYIIFEFDPKLIFFAPDRITAIIRTIKEPEKSPTLNVVYGLCCSPNGGTLNLFIARCRSPPSKSCVKVASVSRISRSMSLLT